MSRRFCSGEKIGRWTILLSGSFRKEEMVPCKCDCGTSRHVRAANLEKRLSKSCGCARKESCTSKLSTHGLSKTPLYRVWKGMRKRCLNPKEPGFHNYGGRGVSVCNRWNEFANFDKDMGSSYGRGMFIERIDNDGNYEPKNCRWATRKEQNRNKRDTIYLTYRGTTMPLVSWCEKLGVNYWTAHQRYHSGFSSKEILSLTHLPRRKLQIPNSVPTP